MKHKRCNITKAEGSSERTVTGWISTTTVDRDGEVLLPGGLDASEFNKNPVVLFGHDASRLPVGKAFGITKTPRGVRASVKFASRPPEHPDAAEWVPDTIHHLYREGVLSAFSVGFTVPEGGIRDATAKDAERFGDGVRRVITRWAMHEFSIVPVPANPDALATMVSKCPSPYVLDQFELGDGVDCEPDQPRRLVIPARRLVVG